MDQKDNRKRIAELYGALHKSQAPEAAAAKQLVDLLFEEAKRKLVSSDGNDTLRIQGEAQAFERMIIGLRYPSPTLKGE